MLRMGLEANVDKLAVWRRVFHFDEGIPDTVHFNVPSNTPLEGSYCSATLSLNLSGPVVTCVGHISGGRW